MINALVEALIALEFSHEGGNESMRLLQGTRVLARNEGAHASQQ